MNFDQLVTLCQHAHEEIQKSAVRAVDAHLVVRNWLFGQHITEFEQNGSDRAEYGARILDNLSDRLKSLKIRGSSTTRLKLYRLFYRQFPIHPTLSDESQQPGAGSLAIRPTASDESPSSGLSLPQTQMRNLINTFPLGWSHYVEL